MARSDSTKPLTSLALNNLKPGDTIADAGEYRGLRAVCGNSGVKTFIYRYRSPVDQKVKQVKIGRYRESKLKTASGDSGLLSLSEARVLFQGLKALRDNGVCPGERSRQQQKESDERKAKAELEKKLSLFTVKKLCDNYLSDCIDGVRTRKSASECRRALYGDPVKELGDMPAADVTAKEVFDMCMGVVERGANVQAGFILRELTAAFDHAIDSELPGEHVNPCYQAKGRLKRKRVRLSSKRGTRVLNDGELAALLHWLPGSRFTPGQKGVLYFTLLTGCRTGEVCSMRWADVDLDSSVWHLKETKTGVPRNVQLSTQAVAFLEQQKRMSDEYVFPQITGKAVQQKTLTERMWFMRKNDLLLDVEPWTPHDLRRSVRTGLARLGCPSEVAEAVLGHTKGGIEAVYNLHRYEQESREWLQQWCDHLEMLGYSEKVVSLGVRHAG
ncbi:MAG: integrase [Porticoccus sp.]|nr:integrase [Porticoccus sp.]|tara:strand:+ start:271 stop:1599 length:1329 start_codon:yes stop_codon:yes gene_type:complete